MKVTDIKPQGLKLIVKVLKKEEEESEGGIVIAETVNAELSEGEVIAVSEQLKGVIEIGDKVLYPSKRGVGQYIDKQPYLWLDAEPSLGEVWAIVSRELEK